MAIIGVDFDGTCVTHEYPKVGVDIGAQEVLKDLVKANHKLILWTIRDGKYLKDATDWFNRNNIPLFGVNKNPDQNWSASPKAYCNLYLDDAALGVPLIHLYSRPHVNWKKVRTLLVRYGYLKED